MSRRLFVGRNRSKRFSHENRDKVEGRNGRAERTSKKAELKQLRTGTKKKALKREAILEHLGMAAPQIDQFTQALFGKVESVIIVCAILILVVGTPLYWLRLKLERALIRVIRSVR